MAGMSVDELCVMSKALERVIRAVPNKPRPDITVAELADAMAAAAEEGVRDEDTLVRLTLERIASLVGQPPSEPEYARVRGMLG